VHYANLWAYYENSDLSISAKKTLLKEVLIPNHNNQSNSLAGTVIGL